MYFTPPRPRVFAHRGFGHASHDQSDETSVAENSLAAFAAAQAAGCEYVETDVRATRDGVAIILHDPTFIDANGHERHLADISSEELASLPRGRDGSLPLLAHALAEFPDLRFNIDLKTADVAAPAVRAILEHAATNRVLVTSFSSRRRRLALKTLPGVAAGAGRSDALIILFAAVCRQNWMLRRIASQVRAVQLPVAQPTPAILTPRRIRRMQSAGIEVHVWTPNTAVEIEYWLRRGVDGVVTDRADLAFDVIASLEQK